MSRSIVLLRGFPMNVIVDGANGFIGSHLVRKLCDSGYTVFAIVRNIKENISSIDCRAKIIYSEISELKAHNDIFPTGCIFVHLAWQGVNGKDKSDPFVQLENVKMCLEAATFAKSIGSSKFFVSGTVAENAVYSFKGLEHLAPSLLYSAGKTSARIMCEAYCKANDLRFVWLQFANVYGPENSTGNLVSYTLDCILKNGRPALFGPAEQPYDFLYLDELIDAVYLAVTSTSLSKSVYYLGSGSPRILRDYLMVIGELCHKVDLIKIGARQDDGIKYSFDMFDCSDTFKELGNYVADTFESHINMTISSYRGNQYVNK